MNSENINSKYTEMVRRCICNPYTDHLQEKKKKEEEKRNKIQRHKAKNPNDEPKEISLKIFINPKGG